ncbi:hypothetical protein [Sulfitobacter sp. 915]|uniref:hypothetical protein n=1 Tax=Sulfitobacter sp. 915 TaxID=3368558 RepID=UPI0037470ED2
MSAPAEPMVTVSLRKKEAEAISYGIADVLCWVNGFNAARDGTDLETGPLGTKELRDMNIKLKDALDKADAQTKEPQK